jgi:hypothetical protein
MRFSAAGNFAAGAKLSQPRAAGSQIVNSYLSVWRLELSFWARSAGTGTCGQLEDTMMLPGGRNLRKCKKHRSNLALSS